MPDDKLCEGSTFTLEDSDYNELCMGERTGQGITLEPGSGAWCFENGDMKEFIPEYSCLCCDSTCNKTSVLLSISQSSVENCVSTEVCDECFETLDDTTYYELCTGEHGRRLQQPDYYAVGHIMAINANHLATVHHHIGMDSLDCKSGSGVEFIHSNNRCERPRNDRSFFRRKGPAASAAGMEYGIPIKSADSKATIHVHSVQMGELRLKGTYKLAQVAEEPQCTWVAAWPYIRIIGSGTSSGCGVSLWTLGANRSMA